MAELKLKEIKLIASEIESLTSGTGGAIEFSPGGHGAAPGNVVGNAEGLCRVALILLEAAMSPTTAGDMCERMKALYPRKFGNWRGPLPCNRIVVENVLNVSEEDIRKSKRESAQLQRGSLGCWIFLAAFLGLAAYGASRLLGWLP